MGLNKRFLKSCKLLKVILMKVSNNNIFFCNGEGKKIFNELYITNIQRKNENFRFYIFYSRVAKGEITQKNIGRN